MLLDILIAVAQKGGVENVINMTAEYLINHGFKIRVVQLAWENVKWTNESIEFYALSEGKDGHTLGEFISLYTEFLNTHEKPHAILATAWPMMSLVAKSAALNAITPPCKIISWLHAPIERYEKAGYGGIDCLKCCDASFVLNYRTEKILAENGIKNPILVHNPVDFDRCRQIAGTNPEEKTDTAVFIGRLSAEKHVDTIISGIASTNWKLLIIGDGNEKDKLTKLAKELNCTDRILFLGWQSNPWEMANDVKVLILASEYESFSLVAREALSCGIPVISTPVDGIIEIIKPGVNGYLFPHGDSKSLSNILNMISDKRFPDILPEACMQSVKDDEKDTALEQFRQLLLSCISSSIF